MEATRARPVESLRQQLHALEGMDYAAYQSIRGSYAYNRFQLHIDQVPKDPYAPPGSGVFRVTVPQADAGFPDAYSALPARCIVFRDFLARQFHNACRLLCPGRRGTGNSGLIAITEPSQEILDRTSVQVDGGNIQVRFFLGLPASGRNIDARTADTMLFDELPRIVESALFAANLDLNSLERHIHTSEDAEHIRKQLPRLGLVAFIADGSVLPRSSGIDPQPLQGEAVIPFKSPEELRVSMDLPHAGIIKGMGIPIGVTLIVGGGYHGKSTVLQALELGIYNHIPGDGRELCVCLPTTVKVRATSGRSITNTDISAFINNLPLRQDTTSFSTQNASGSTSQAAFIAESLEAGARVLLMDEDTCAANLMIRDHRMQQLVARNQEPITAFVDRVRQIHQELGVSTVLVMGGSGDYLDVADCVIQMVDFEPQDATNRARDVANALPSQRMNESVDSLPRPRDRSPDGKALDPRNEYGHFRISAQNTHHLILGQTEIDLSDVEQIMEAAQARAIGHAMDYSKRYMDGHIPLREVVGRVIDDVDRSGLDVLDPRHVGDLAGFRGLELAAALNRVRGLIFHQE
ncbi:MAG: ABC-ATPase domain-containing protein [Myxococcota bacterium]|jgi:predicted ABC-class ATPase